MRQFNSIAIEQYNNKKIALGDNLKVRFSVVRKVFYTCRVGGWVSPSTPHRTGRADLPHPALLRRCPIAGSNSGRFA